MELDSLQALYVDELKDLYSAEKQILKALPKMIKAASHEELATTFSEHLRVTERQVQRLEKIFADLDESPRGKKCIGMEGLIEEAQELLKEKPNPDVLDAGLISKAQHVEHYEIAGYGTVRTYAEQLGFTRHAELLQQTLDEEGEADKRLSALAETSINVEAEMADAGAGSRGVSSAGRSMSRGSGSRTLRSRSSSRAGR
ncbi:MAG: ferritin-like domain-containing protein [Gemmatimonadota bacterium]|nr:ferritin-like domain-containing protein [Gemmatimonadota bacterium]